ncbi:hypothetical protein G6F37_010985 [Rhizopus arrhizus]|nr:hypothetical protein G6F38_010036 [Rhizopus arrhizus]KAG1151460.1 hypothetical protein G6F37_010985 [Rhizopus arrhizus]
MSSLQLPSFIYDNNKSKKKLPENRPELQRTASSGTLSKVKRFGSKLIRSKTQRDGSRKPPSLDFKKDTRNSQSSLTASSTTSSLEEHVKTPTTADYDKETFNLDHPKQIITIEEQIKQEKEGKEKEPMKKEEDEEEEKREEMMEEEMDESKLSELALIRHHLNIALKQADEEIEDELKANRENMLNTLNTFPKISFQ